MVENLNLSGYQPYTEVLAQRSTRGSNRETYIISLPLYLIGTYLPVPDPEKPFPGNRRVNRRHAESFGTYWRENDNWVAPPLLVDTSAPLDEGFTPHFSAGGVEFGVLQLHQGSTGLFDILDGQHRILGWKLIGDKLTEELKYFRNKLASADREDTDVQREWRNKIAEVEASIKRYESEYVTVEILHGLTENDHRQAFNDIATNALGIPKSMTVNFDSRSIINRVAMEAEKNIDLLDGRVEWEKDRVLSRNENLVSGRNLADIIRHLVVGIKGRITQRREDELNESDVYELTIAFFTALIDNFPQIKKIDEGEISVPDLREQDMILSPTVLRVLAGAFHNLAVNSDDPRLLRLDKPGYQKATRLFANLSNETAYPLNESWRDTGVFDEGSKTPGSRAQDLSKLTEIMTSWGENGQIFTPATD